MAQIARSWNLRTVMTMKIFWHCPDLRTLFDESLAAAADSPGNVLSQDIETIDAFPVIVDFRPTEPQ